VRRAGPLDLPLAAGAPGVPRQRALHDALRMAILEGRLRPGTALPSTRALALQLEAARGTVVAVFEQLAAEGYLVARVGSGTVVAAPLPDAWFTPRRAPGRPAAVPAKPDHPGPRLSRWGRALALSPVAFPLSPRPAARPFRAHLPAVDAFPAALWGRLVARRARKDERLLLSDGDPRGYPPLREALAEHLRVARGVVCTADQVVITPSVQQTLDLVARLVLDPGDRAWIEDPGYGGARAALVAAGAAVVPVPVDRHGMDVARGIARAPDARLVYVTPAHQAPLGVVLRLDRRLSLLEWAAASRAVIIEDDYDSEYRYQGRPLPALQGLDRKGLVVHAGSFSKTLLPSLRLGYAVVPHGLLDRFVRAKSVVDRFTPGLLQAALADFLEQGHFPRHLRRMRALYAERRAALLQALASELGGELEVVGASAGLDLSVLLPAGVDDREVARRLGQVGLETVALSQEAISRHRPLGRGGLLLGFAAFSPARLRHSVAQLAANRHLWAARTARRASSARAR
jgi:GntR family transcriptional regulator/MocR family aminotransferase